ncbi:MAG: biotin/lipoyl-binding protein [Acidobacteriota bacterium]
MHVISASLRRVVQHDVSGIGLYDPEAGELRAHVLEHPGDLPAFARGTPIPMEGTTGGVAFTTGQPVFVEDMMKPTKRRLKSFAVPTLILIAGATAWWVFLRGPGAPEGIIALSGRIESDDAAVAAKTQGRIREITVREGDQVKAGQVIPRWRLSMNDPPTVLVGWCLDISST